MARTITHQGYTIQSTPHETAGDQWRLHIRISRTDHRGVRTSEFPAHVLCASEQYQEARAAFEAGLQRIPGDVMAHFYLGDACQGLKAGPARKRITRPRCR